MRIQATCFSFIDNIVITVLLLQIVVTILSTLENFHIDTKNRTVYGTVRFSSTKYRTAYGIKNRPPYRTEPYENRRYGIYRSTVRSSKYGPLQLHLSEAAAMQFIASNTPIPVPKVYCAFERKGVTYIVMSRLVGSPIGQNWSHRSDQNSAVPQKDYLSFLRL